MAAGREGDPSSPVAEGWITFPHHPRFGNNYRGLGGRLDLLLECYSYLTYEERIRITYAWLLESLRFAAGDADRIGRIVAASRTPPDSVAVSYELQTCPDPVEILTRSPRTRDGAPTSVTLPFLGRFVGRTVVRRPRAYVLPGALAGFLARHGLRTEPAPRAATVEAATFEGKDYAAGRKILEAAGTSLRRASWRTESRPLPPGSILLPTDQPLGALAVYLSEPESDDGLVENGLLPTPREGDEFDVLRLID
jgi:hypothetical protein